MAVRHNYRALSESVIRGSNGLSDASGYRARTQIIDTVDVLWHILGAAFALYIFAWHFTDQAARLPGARGFGWFFKFLTFWGWTLQTVQYTFTAVFLCVPRKSKAWPALAKVADDISCVAFTVAMTVFLQFWILHWVTGGLVERSQDRPPWLGFVMHVINGILAVSDILVSNPRTFGRRSQVMLCGFAGVYGTFLAACRLDLDNAGGHKEWHFRIILYDGGQHDKPGSVNMCLKYMNKRYPYPFMNKADPVVVYFAMVIMSVAVMYCISMGGKAWAWTCGRVLAKADLLEEARVARMHTNGNSTNGKARKRA